MENLPNGDSEYFSFTGTKGEALDIEAICQYLDSANPQPFNPTYLDTVISVYDANHQKIAENNNIPGNGDDADLFTILPADGTYYVRVTECWTWSSESGAKCVSPQQKTHTQYELQIYGKDPSQGNVVEFPVPMPGNTAATAIPVKFQKLSGQTNYRRTDVFGFFQTATDVDWFSFTPPSDTPVPAGRLTMFITPVPAGATEDGSTEGIGAVTVYDGTGKTTLAQVNGSVLQAYGAFGQRIDVPVTAGTPYLYSVARNDGIVGSNDFYVTWALSSYGSPLEMQNATNGTVAGAEALTLVSSASLAAYYVDGDLTPAGTDVDYFSAAVPANLPATATVYASCGGQWYGSGLRGMTIALRDAAGNMLTSGTETATEYAYTSQVAVPAGAQSVFLEVSGGSQDPVVTGTYYSCGVYFFL
jgi:hypothetical protein